MKTLIKNFAIIRWIVMISIGLFLILILDEAIISAMHGNPGSVIIKTINGKAFLLKIPVKPVARQEKPEGAQLYRYNLTVKKLWGSSWALGFIPEKNKLFLTASHMGFFSVFILDYAITDPKMEKTLLDELKQIKPYKIIR